MVHRKAPAPFWLLLFCLFFIAPLPSWGAPLYYILQSAYSAPKNPIHTRLLSPWMKDLQSYTKRDVTFQLYMNNAIVPEDAVIPALLSNTLDAAIAMPTSYPKLFANVLAFLPPHIAQDSRHASAYLWEVYKTDPAFATEINRIGKVLGIWGSDRNVLLSKNGSMRSLESLKGKKILVTSDMQLAQVNAWGAQGVRIHEADLRAALEGNIGQAYYGTMPYNSAATLGHIVKDITILPASTKMFFVVINWDQWATIPDNVKKYIESTTGKEWGAEAANILYQVTEDELEAFRTQGARIITLDAEANQKFIDAESHAFIPKWTELLTSLGAANPSASIEKAYTISKKTVPATPFVPTNPASASSPSPAH